MRIGRRRRPSASLVVASIALLVALGGSAFGAVEQLLPPASVGAQQLRAGAVTTPKIRGGAVTGAKVRDGSLREADFADGELSAGPGGQVWASGFVNQTGGLEPGANNVGSVTKSGIGSYRVQFETPSEGGCATFIEVFSYLIVATGEQIPGASRVGVTNEYIDVSTVGPDYLPADRGFDFLVVC